MREIVFIVGTPVRVFIALLFWILSACLGEPATIHWRALLREGLNEGIQ